MKHELQAMQDQQAAPHCSPEVGALNCKTEPHSPYCHLPLDYQPASTLLWQAWGEVLGRDLGMMLQQACQISKNENPNTKVVEHFLEGQGVFCDC